MSRGFVKEDDLEHAGTDLPERPISGQANYVTPVGLKQLADAAGTLEAERSPLVSRKDDPVAQQRLAMIDRDLRYLHARLESAVLVDPHQQPSDTVLFGATVKVEDEVGDTHTFMIVGEDEADIATNSVSWLSPLAQALLNQKIGDSVTWQRPLGDLELEIIDIRY